jgi:hypothetical protein
MTSALPTTNERMAPDWELDYYSRPIVEADGKKRWELLICSTQTPTIPTELTSLGPGTSFRWARSCPASNVNSLWLREALEAALVDANEKGYGKPRRLRCWRGSMRAMVQRAVESLGMELVPSRRCYGLVDWLRERDSNVYVHEPGYLAGPLAPPPQPIPPVPVPLPETLRGDSWSWASLPLASLEQAVGWDIDFPGLIVLPSGTPADAWVPGIRLFSRHRGLAIAGWLSGLEPVRLEICGRQLVLEAGMEDRWLLATLPEQEAQAASEALSKARVEAGGIQFIAVQSSEEASRFEGFWILRDLPDG